MRAWLDRRGPPHAQRHHFHDVVGEWQGMPNRSEPTTLILDADGNYRIDAHLRCVMAPCPSFEAGRWQLREGHDGEWYVLLLAIENPDPSGKGRSVYRVTALHDGEVELGLSLVLVQGDGGAWVALHQPIFNKNATGPRFLDRRAVGGVAGPVDDFTNEVADTAYARIKQRFYDDKDQIADDLVATATPKVKQMLQNVLDDANTQARLGTEHAKFEADVRNGVLPVVAIGTAITLMGTFLMLKFVR
jgi:hypothetical protein